MSFKVERLNLNGKIYSKHTGVVKEGVWNSMQTAALPVQTAVAEV